MNSERFVILGNGGAGINAAMAARSAGYTGEIHMVSDTHGPAFSPMLAPYYLKGMIPWEQCFPFGKDFYRKYDVKCHFGSPVVSLDAVNKIIFLERDEKVSYDKCLIATGADPLIPPVPGLRESSKALPFRTSVHTKAMEHAISKAEKVVVMGASLVGVKLAELLKKKGLEVILLDIAPIILPQGSHPKAAEFLKEYFIQQGIDVRLSCSIKNLKDTEEGVVCPFPEGVDEDASFVAVCTGVKPNLDFIDSSQIDIDQAVLVDERMCTSVEGLYSAGDVCQGQNRQSGKNEWLGTWGNACYQGRTAGYNIAGRKTAYQGMIPQNISPFFDWTYSQMGDANREGEGVHVVTEGNPFEGPYRLLVFEKDILVGANLINCAEKAGVLKNAIEQKQEIGTHLKGFKPIYWAGSY